MQSHFCHVDCLVHKSVLNNRFLIIVLILRRKMNLGRATFVSVFSLVQRQPLEMFYEKVFLKISHNSQGNTCVAVSVLIKLQGWGLQLYYKGNLAKIFSCYFCEIFPNTFFTEHLQATASACGYNAIILFYYVY